MDLLLALLGLVLPDTGPRYCNMIGGPIFGDRSSRKNLQSDMRHIGSLVITLTGVAAFVVYVSFFFGRVTFNIDTPTYLFWSPWVPLGYPFFLSSIKSTIGLKWTAAIQIALFVTACVLVGLSIRRLTGRWITGAFALLLLLGHTEVVHLHGSLLSEGLYIPMLLLNVGGAIGLIASPSRASASMVGITAAAAMFVRPAAYFISLGTVFLLFCLRNARRYGPITIFIVLFIGTWLVNFAIRGGSQSQTGRVLFPHVAFLFEPRFASPQYEKFALAV